MAGQLAGQGGERWSSGVVAASSRVVSQLHPSGDCGKGGLIGTGMRKREVGARERLKVVMSSASAAELTCFFVC